MSDQSGRQLDPPPVADSDPASLEVLRVWASPQEGQQLTLNPCWRDPGAWGLMLADLARHAAQAYAARGHDDDEALARILEAFDAERGTPTDSPKDITGES